MIKNIRFILPLIVFGFILAVLWRGLMLHPAQIPSPFIGKAAPAFSLPTLFDKKKLMTEKDFLGHVTLFNVWATWCAICAEEHETLLALANQEHVLLYGLNYKDDMTTAKKWLAQNGNPYQLIAVDRDGQTAINWGVYGVPETFLIDQKGRVRYKQTGAIDETTWENVLRPMIQHLESEVQ